MSRRDEEIALQPLNGNKKASYNSEAVYKTKTLTHEQYEELKERTGTIWKQLPDSVIGTLIYFLLVENNEKAFRICETLRCLVLIGFPVYYIYIIQFNILYELWRSLPALGDIENSGLCVNNVAIELAAISVFFIFILPNCVSIISEAATVLTCTQAALTEEEDDDKVLIVEIYAPLSKRIFIWVLVCFAEVCLLLVLCYVGTQFMYCIYT
jgi:hypothetical protein